MAEYNAKSDSSLVFNLTSDNGHIGKLTYKSWFKFSAVIEVGNTDTYQVDPKGFWGTTVEVKDGDNVLIRFSMSWSGNIVIQTFFNAIEKGYEFKHRGFFKESFVLLDESGKELLVMKPHLKWNLMNIEYQITTTDDFEGFRKKELLLMTTVHYANYYMSMMMSGG